ncbi:MAG: (deoxy)nucleoside triphosphate pyrophosphohydrolase [Sedimentibacter sp.]
MKTIEVVAAVIKGNGENENKIFATQRGYGEFKGMWEFPGGKMEPNESREDALKREIEEELNTEISICDFIQTIEYDYPEFHLTMHCFLCEVVSGELTLLEHEDSKWLSADELHSVDWLPADIDVLGKVVEYLNN